MERAEGRPMRSTDESWRHFRRLSAAMQAQALERYCVTASYKPLDAGEGGMPRAQLALHVEENAWTDYQEELWMRLLGEEDLDRQIRLMEEWNEFIIESSCRHAIEGPVIRVRSLALSIRDLADGRELVVRDGGGISLRRLAGVAPSHATDEDAGAHQWVFSRRGEAVLLDSTLLEQGVFVSRAQLGRALARALPDLPPERLS